MAEPATFAQIRSAALEALSGRVARPVGVLFDNFANLKIGVRAALARKGIREPQVPFGYLADSALNAEEETIYKRVYDALVAEGILDLKHGTDQFTASLLPHPFAQVWQYVEALGRGGQGTAIKVQRHVDGVWGALKRPHSMDPISTERFRREVAILEGIKHPAIVHLLDANLDPAKGALGYVTPLGTPLDVYWRDRAPTLSATERYDRAYEMLRHMAEGLALLHAQAVIHRDLKPENVVMIDDKAVIIDFGVALRPQDDRLSVLDQRVVANNFATPPAAHYGLHEEIAAWDCLGLAWIYGYLVGEGERPKQFHWRFHPLVPEDRKDRAKAILAACSHERTIPTDAKAFIALMDRFRLGTENSVSVSSGIPLDAAEAAHAEAQAASLVREVDEAELAEIAIQILSGPLAELRDALNRVCVGTARLPVKLNVNTADPTQKQILPNRPMGQILQQVYDETRQGFNGEQCIFSCTCGAGRDHFKIGAFVAYTRYYVGDGLPFRLVLSCKIENGKPPAWPELLFNMNKDGAFQHAVTGDVTSPERLATLANRWMAEPERWTAIG